MFDYFPPKKGLYDPSLEKDSCGVGAVIDKEGAYTHKTVRDALQVLVNLSHRAACCEETGDGAGILTALPHDFFAVEAKKLGHSLPEKGDYGVGTIFLDPSWPVEGFKEVVAQSAEKVGLNVLFWRDVPVDDSCLAPLAKRTQPKIEQVFVGKGSLTSLTELEFERKLYLVRLYIRQYLQQLQQKNTISDNTLAPGLISASTALIPAYVCSISSRIIVYKGLLTPIQVSQYYNDLSDPNFGSPLALVHSRFSTNTFPSWTRAQPNRMMCHNGEINTIRGNINWMRAREGVMHSDTLGDGFSKLSVIEPVFSDSGMFDNVLELLTMSGRDIYEVMMLMIPEAHQNDTLMDKAKKDFYSYNACVMEPWDGPAMIAFTDGRYVGATLDRNGLRPCRIYETEDGRIILSSEAGVLPVAPETVTRKSRLEPGKMFLVDLKEKRVVKDEELKQKLAAANNYGAWLDEQQITWDNVNVSKEKTSIQVDEYELAKDSRVHMFGYSLEHVHMLLTPMLDEADEGLGSMGNDAALACMSRQPRVIYEYFKQLFAQVTNPPIDPIREGVVMSLECQIGPEGNLLNVSKEQCRRFKLPEPILTLEQLEAIKNISYAGWKTLVIDITNPVSTKLDGLMAVLNNICEQAEKAVHDGYQFVVLSDRQAGPTRVPVSTLLASGAVHHYLIKKKLRTKIGIVIETGEAREVHHHCLLLGFGADAICPYMVYEIGAKLKREAVIKSDVPDYKLVANYIKSVCKGIMKVMAKMGISTLQSYKGAQIFEAVGLSQEVIDKCFSNTASRIQGSNFVTLAKEVAAFHAIAYPHAWGVPAASVRSVGDYHWREGGERHTHEPNSIASVQEAVKSNSKQAFKKYSQIADSNTKECMLRGLVDFRPSPTGPIPIDEPLPNGDSKRSAIKQVASARFGVTYYYLANSDELQIKIAQGAKPGEGGELPGYKVDGSIAKTRHATPGVGLISPPPHHDIYSIEDLGQLIFDLKHANPKARISVKLVSESGVGVVASGCVKAGADHVLIAGHDGGTGAAKWTGIKHAGLPWELGLAEAHQTLVLNNLRGQAVVQTDGQMRTGRDVTIGALLGAEEFGFGTGPLIALGCIMMRKCHLNTCPVGIATQDPVLRAKFAGQPEHVVNFFFMVAEEVREYMAQLGFRKFQDMVGRVDLLRPVTHTDISKADTNYNIISNLMHLDKRKTIDLTDLLTPAWQLREGVPTSCTIPNINHDGDIKDALDLRIMQEASSLFPTSTKDHTDINYLHSLLYSTDAGDSTKPVHLEFPVCNIDRAVGTLLSFTLANRYGENGLPAGTLHVKLTGSAGQSFGAFLAPGVTLEIEGDSNDYVGKGLSGGQLIVYPPATAKHILNSPNIIVGNVALYGATSGEAYLRGVAAERFAVRNSGAHAVVEGTGDHGCEYMTGGRVVVLGKTGVNFAAGMSGGIAYIYDAENTFTSKCNTGLVELSGLTFSDQTEYNELDDEAFVKDLIQKHLKYTESPVAKSILDSWADSRLKFVKVLPTDYKKVLLASCKPSTKYL